eukprot:CAMPEP_0202343324 /NCGR_PEP_ID=MMETSP1126-20121109/3494_1 /ASSEMBLY_ACC=CAM_ASM_000457 /TAXON_ID=3047 /ORGANISM="Dunaliella tertiolecta, Strain CCMP1320" /LENGTH=422 /DNA_ID=CAMNT_0048934377 /DNA_START=261 /DNA_END=1529 /DNA_ORIENTATION=-
MDLVVVCDADAAKEITQQKNYPKSPTYDTLHPFIGAKSMVCSEGKVWSKQRKAFAPGFQFAFLKDLVPTFASKTQLLIDRFARAADTGEVLSFHTEAVLLTVDVICQVALSVNFGYLTSKEPPEIFYLFNELLTNTAELARAPHTAWMRFLPWVYMRSRNIQKRFDSILIRVIQHRLTETQQEDPLATGPRDILGLAIKTARDAKAEEGGGALDLEDVLAQVKTFLFAGHDTTASTAAFTVYEISRNPEVEAKVLEEVDRVCGGKPPSSDDLTRGGLKYLGCVIKESLRLWPPGGTARIAPPGATLQGYDIGGRPIYLPHFPIHRDPDYWGPDAAEFKPERWLDEAYLAKLHPCCYMPFSKGARDCIGQTFAIMEVKTLLAMLYSNYTFKYACAEPEGQAYRITSYPKNRVPVTVHSRSRQK